MEAIGKGWFSEVNVQWKGIAQSLKVVEVLWDKQSDYQHIQVFKSESFGNVLVIDGVIQCTEKDEIAYHEMLTHIPMFAHPDPKRVLIVGGGDGGIIREVVKHEGVQEVVICEIDQMVIDVSKKFLPNISAQWEHPKVQLHCGDAAEYIKRPEVGGYFDVILVDSSDPVGPAEALFESPFYRAMRNALRSGGRIATQAESMWLHLDLIKGLFRKTKGLFNNVEYATTQIPTYPGGQIGFLVCTHEPEQKDTISSAAPVREVSTQMQDQLFYYSADLHKAAFVLPAFAQRAIAEAKASEDAPALEEQEE